MKEIIKSNQNKTIKHIKSLQSKKYRDEYGEFVIEGIKLTREALQYNGQISLAVFSDTALEDRDIDKLRQELEQKAVPTCIADEKLFKEISETQTPQGILAVIKKPIYDLDDLTAKKDFNIIILDEIRDPGNLGTIIRTADACGLDGVVLSKGCVDVHNGKAVRATMGSLFHLPIFTDIDAVQFIESLNMKGAETIGADPYGRVSCIDLPDYDRTAIIIGNEANGMSDSVKAAVRNNVKIPMPGQAESLNAGIAAALMMYEIVVRKQS